MSKIVSLSIGSISDDGEYYFSGVHIPQKDPPPPQSIQDELIAKADEKRERKAAKRIREIADDIET